MCTSVIVGQNASADGSLLFSRSADSSALKAQHFVIHPACDWPEGSIYRTQDFDGANNFSYPLPAHTLRYSTAPNWKTQLHGAVGFNEMGLGVSGTESIFARDDALEKDPYNMETGITEDDIPDVLLARCVSAREAVELLGNIIETQGAAEGFGVGIVDAKESWYLETGTGHQWIAQRTPLDQYMATGNQGRLRSYNPDNEDQLSSPTVIDWARENGFYNPETDGEFDFARAYTRNDERDRVYNDPRVWIMQKRFNPEIIQDPHDGRNFPVYLKPKKPISVADLRATMRDHFNGSEHDPYTNGKGGEEEWRPVSVFRTYEAHVMQVRPNLPTEIACVIHLCWGMSDLSVFVPFYQGLEEVPEHYGCGTDQADHESVYWKFRKVQTLAMTDYVNLAPVVKSAYEAFEAEIDQRMVSFEKAYLAAYEVDPAGAHALLQLFNLQVLAEAEDLAESLLDRLFTLRTESIQAANFFANRSKKD